MSSNACSELRIASALSKNVIPSAVPRSRSKSPRKPFASGTELGPWSRTRLISSSVRFESRPSKLATRAYLALPPSVGEGRAYACRGRESSASYGCGAVGVGPRKMPGGAVSECGSEKARTKPATASAATTRTAATSLIDAAEGAARRLRPSGAAEACEAAISLLTRPVARFFRAASKLSRCGRMLQSARL
jgi:hypothetical protein